MKTRIARRIIAAMVALACALALAFVAYADPPSARAPNVDGVEHHWVVRVMRYPPDVQQTNDDRRAIKAATAALAVAPVNLRTLANSLKGANPVIAGHEVLVWSEGKAADLLVSADGVVRLLRVGTPQQLLVSHATAAKDPADRDAIEIAEAAFDVATDLGTSPVRASGGLVAAHEVGFAHEDGSHLVVRVDAAGNATFPDW